MDRAAAAVENTAKASKETARMLTATLATVQTTMTALQKDAETRAKTTERAGSLIDQLTPYLVGGAGLLVAGGTVWKTRKSRRRA